MAVRRDRLFRHLDGLALIVIVVGTAEAFFGGLRTMVPSPSGHERRDVWLRYARAVVTLPVTLRFEEPGQVKGMLRAIRKT